MLAFARLIFWIAAALFAAAPLIWSILKTPSKFLELFASQSYMGQNRDLAYVAIAILSLGILDSFDCFAPHLLGLADRRERAAWRFTSLFLCIAMMFQLATYASWINSNDFQNDKNLTSLGFMILSACLCALMSRIVLIVEEQV